MSGSANVRMTYFLRTRFCELESRRNFSHSAASSWDFQQILENSTFELSPFLWKELWIATFSSLVSTVLRPCSKIGQSEGAASSKVVTRRLASTHRTGAQVADERMRALARPTLEIHAD